MSDLTPIILPPRIENMTRCWPPSSTQVQSHVSNDDECLAALATIITSLDVIPVVKKHPTLLAPCYCQVCQKYQRRFPHELVNESALKVDKTQLPQDLFSRSPGRSVYFWTWRPFCSCVKVTEREMRKFEKIRGDRGRGGRGQWERDDDDGGGRGCGGEAEAECGV